MYSLHVMIESSSEKPNEQTHVRYGKEPSDLQDDRCREMAGKNREGCND
jgi:hypothetical protein